MPCAPFLIRELAERFGLDEATLNTEADRLKRAKRPAPYQHERQQPTAHSQQQQPTAHSQQPTAQSQQQHPTAHSQQQQPTAHSPQQPLLPPEREILRMALTVEHGLALILHQYHVEPQTFYTERGQHLFRRVLVAEAETEDVVDQLINDPELDAADRALISELVGSAIQLSTKWKDFDIQIPDHDTARAVRDALIGIALQRTVAEIEQVMQQLHNSESDTHYQRLAHDLQLLMRRREDLRRRYSDDPFDISWLDVDSTSAS